MILISCKFVRCFEVCDVFTFVEWFHNVWWFEFYLRLFDVVCLFDPFF